MRKKFMSILMGIVLLFFSTSTAWATDLITLGAMQTARKINVEEKPLAEIRNDLDSGRYTSRDLIIAYLERIAVLDKNGPKLNSILELNPDMFALADVCDAERKAGKASGFLHGIPVVVKDNIDTADKMHTSAGSIALKDHYALKDSFVAQRLRKAGAIIFGKTNMTEWANYIAKGMPGGYSSRGGQVLNPYNPNFPVRGSSTGSAVAVSANLVSIAIGTETSGSILHPSYLASVVGLKPTVGLVSRTGIVPIMMTQDTAGPITRTVADAAMLLNAIAGLDTEDSATLTAVGKIPKDYGDFLKPDALRGARIGVGRQLFYQLNEEQTVLMEQTIQEFKDAGAIIVDPVEMPGLEIMTPNPAHAKMAYASQAMSYEFKPAINNYLKTVEPYLPVHTLSELIKFNDEDSEKRLRYGQILFINSDKTSGSLSDPEYLADRLRDWQYSRKEGIDYALSKYKVDAIILPPVGSLVTARAGYPALSIPAGYQQDGLPWAFILTASAWSEPKLISLGYSYEKATHHRKAPVFNVEP
ncbi:MAG: amidase family protein [Negativicutes bacterium]